MNSIKTVNAAETVYGAEWRRSLDGDSAEAYHEASKLYKQLAFRQTDTYVLQANPNALVSTTRSVKKWSHAPATALPAPTLPNVSLGEILMRRRSQNVFASKPVTLSQLATVLFAACGVTKRVPVTGGEQQVFRTAPSGGALYPLDCYVAVHRVDDLAPGLYYYDPLTHALGTVRGESVAEALADACVYPDAVLTGAATLLFGGVFWRSRFKYRLRAYRFTVLEAGHVAQNALLAADALGLGALPLGGFYDGAVDRLLDLDGVNEGTLYAVALGAR
ncbi:MAG TPA: SagB/ThcOx family dehydrogenase [Candidatus Elarobacter sp.]|nr:SagB/ThcOx family dehydrogenase [Candidatus Elarobacter sp.]